MEVEGGEMGRRANVESSASLTAVSTKGLNFDIGRKALTLRCPIDAMMAQVPVPRVDP